MDHRGVKSAWNHLFIQSMGAKINATFQIKPILPNISASMVANALIEITSQPMKMVNIAYALFITAVRK